MATSDSRATPIAVRELDDPADPMLAAARPLYEFTLEEAERIPWEWLARTPARRRDWKPGQRRSHLVVAFEHDRPDVPLGFGYGAFLPGYGGYVCYLGVAPAARGRGIGGRVFEFLFSLIEDAARTSQLALPFIIWESHRPPDDTLWSARVRLFGKVGGKWARGIELQTPNYMRPEDSPVRLQLFLRPWAEPESEFDGEHLRAAARGLYEQVYHIPPDDPLHQATMAGAVNPTLVPAVEALGEA